MPVSFVPLALLLPETGQARGGAQFPPTGLLLLRDRQSPAQPSLRVSIR
jgi:hypothetical protein